jgi:hypothetical protein
VADDCQKGGSHPSAALALNSDEAQRVAVKPWMAGERSIGHEAATRGSWHRSGPVAQAANGIGGHIMIKAIVTLLILGFVGMAVLGLLFGLLMPLLAIALKVGLVLLVGYFILRVVSPKDAEKVREKLRRVK